MITLMYNIRSRKANYWNSRNRLINRSLIWELLVDWAVRPCIIGRNFRSKPVYPIIHSKIHARKAPEVDSDFELTASQNGDVGMVEWNFVDFVKVLVQDPIITNSENKVHRALEGHHNFAVIAQFQFSTDDLGFFTAPVYAIIKHYLWKYEFQKIANSKRFKVHQRFWIQSDAFQCSISISERMRDGVQERVIKTRDQITNDSARRSEDLWRKHHPTGGSSVF